MTTELREVPETHVADEMVDLSDVADIEDAPPGEQAEFPGMESPELWPPYRGWKVSRVNLGFGGTVQLTAYLERHRDLGQQLELTNTVEVTVRGSIERRGHKVVREKGDVIGIDGAVSLAVTQVIDTPTAVKALAKADSSIDNAYLAYHAACAELKEAGEHGLVTSEAAIAMGRALSRIAAALDGIPWDEAEAELDAADIDPETGEIGASDDLS